MNFCKLKFASSDAECAHLFGTTVLAESGKAAEREGWGRGDFIKQDPIRRAVNHWVRKGATPKC